MCEEKGLVVGLLGIFTKHKGVTRGREDEIKSRRVEGEMERQVDGERVREGAGRRRKCIARDFYYLYDAMLLVVWEQRRMMQLTSSDKLSNKKAYTVNRFSRLRAVMSVSASSHEEEE